MVGQNCINCGVLFMIPDSFNSRLRETHANFYCPNGHAQYYTGKTEAEKLREELERTQRNLTAAKCAEAEQRTEREKVERKLKRTCKRIHAGVCPCCNRTFTNLARHMATQHPEAAK